MLFTVNVETIGQPLPTLIRQLEPGYGIKSHPFYLTKGSMHYTNNLPIESETGLEVIPGKQNLDTLMELFHKCIGIVNVKSARILAYKEFAWPGHVFANRPVYVQYTVSKVRTRLGCVDVSWLAELKDNTDTTACQLIIKQRIYTNS